MESRKLDEALGDPDWVIAMAEELNQFERQIVQKLVPKPNDIYVIGTKKLLGKLDEIDKHTQKLANSTESRFDELDKILAKVKDSDEVYDPGIELGYFTGLGSIDDFVEWVTQVDKISAYTGWTEMRIFKIAALKLTKIAGLWFDNLNTKRVRSRKEKIMTWTSLKKKLRAKYIPLHYKFECIMNMTSLSQGTMSVSEYTSEFYRLRLICDLEETETMKIGRFIRGLNLPIYRKVKSSPYISFNDVCNLALEFESFQQDEKLKSSLHEFTLSEETKEEYFVCVENVADLVVDQVLHVATTSSLDEKDEPATKEVMIEKHEERPSLVEKVLVVEKDQIDASPKFMRDHIADGQKILKEKFETKELANSTESRFDELDKILAKVKDSDKVYDPGIELGYFTGLGSIDDFVEWVTQVDKISAYTGWTEMRIFKIVALKLTKKAGLWFDNLKTKRVRSGKEKIMTWTSLKKKLRAKYIPLHYKFECIMNMTSLSQGTMSVSEYTSEFYRLRLICDLEETETMKIGRFIHGLNLPIYRNVKSSPYISFNDVCNLVLEFESFQQDEKLKSSLHEFTLSEETKEEYFVCVENVADLVVDYQVLHVATTSSLDEKDEPVTKEVMIEKHEERPSLVEKVLVVEKDQIDASPKFMCDDIVDGQEILKEKFETKEVVYKENNIIQSGTH
ncbi:hypothetical protein AgCh_010108 [Apium graveolens]